MAEVVAPGSPINPPQHRGQHAPHGTKRAAEGSLEHEQRLSKRFDLLNLGMRSTRRPDPAPALTSTQSTAMARACTSPSQARQTPHCRAPLQTQSQLRTL
jgi:hypothetical protein